jgi:hypothetical protein
MSLLSLIVITGMIFLFSSFLLALHAFLGTWSELRGPQESGLFGSKTPAPRKPPTRDSDLGKGESEPRFLPAEPIFRHSFLL